MYIILHVLIVQKHGFIVAISYMGITYFVGIRPS